MVIYRKKYFSMIKTFSESLFEFESKKINESEAGDSGKELSFKEKYDKFKNFLFGTKTPIAANPTVDPEGTSSPRTYQEGSGDFKNVDKMIGLIVQYLDKHGITNPLVQRAILATVGKESAFSAPKEASYKNTSPDRIRKIFGSRFSGLSNEEINQIKKDDSKFWEKVYGGEYGKKNLGNTSPGDGAKYVGRGFNGITGRANYRLYTDMLKKAGTNVDLISNPELLEKDPKIAAEVNALYFVKGLSDSLIKRKYGNKNPNDFKDFQTALKAVVNANAGPGADITKGFYKTTYDAAVSANNRFGAKFDKAVSKVI